MKSDPLLTAHVYEAPTPRCATPACKHKADPTVGIWGNFCEPCAANLARIREEYVEETGRRCISFRNGRKTVQGGPKCCTVGCDEPRNPGDTYCAVCVAMGVEGEAA